MVGVSANLIAETFHNFFVNWNLLMREYRAPTTAKQLFTFAKTTVGMENFKKSMSTRVQYALVAGGVDWAARIAAFRWINNGWQCIL